MNRERIINGLSRCELMDWPAWPARSITYLVDVPSGSGRLVLHRLAGLNVRAGLLAMFDDQACHTVLSNCRRSATHHSRLIVVELTCPTYPEPCEQAVLLQWISCCSTAVGYAPAKNCEHN